MALEIMTISSGRKGNCTYVSSGRTRLLVDAGTSLRRISAALESIGVGIPDINGVLVTHEHSDHVLSLRPLASRGIPIYVHERARAAVTRSVKAEIPFADVDFFDAGFDIGDIRVYPFRVLHDADYPLGYSFVCGGARISVALDLGKATPGVLNNMMGSEIVLLDCNYDPSMLANGEYPPFLKRRIGGTRGHLSNGEAAVICRTLAGHGLKRVILGHISENSNTPETAEAAVAGALRELGYGDVAVCLAGMNETGDLYRTAE